MKRGYRNSSTLGILSICLLSSSKTGQAFYSSHRHHPGSLRSVLPSRSMSNDVQPVATGNLPTDSNGTSSWRSLLEISISKSRDIRGSNYVQLATVENGEPRCRSIVFRGFQEVPTDHPFGTNYCDHKPCLMKMCTDLRSRKVGQANQQPMAEMVWWFPVTMEQYRIRGPLILIGIGNDPSGGDTILTTAREELWGKLTDASRESFFGSAVPGNDHVLDAAGTTRPTGGRGDDGQVLPPPHNFLLMLLDPKHVDYLRLTGGQYRQIDTYTRDDGWTYRRVNP